MKSCISILALLLLTGCETLGQYRPGDAPWDPKRHGALLDQIPNGEGNAGRVCCGHLRTCKPYQSPRC